MTQQYLSGARESVFEQLRDLESETFEVEDIADLPSEVMGWSSSSCSTSSCCSCSTSSATSCSTSTSVGSCA
jgi:thiazolylpeptide-type bacteriocin precursor